MALRLALEALIYDRATLYESDLSAEDYETWQPRKLLATLLEIDPHAASSVSLAIGEEPVGAPHADVMKHVGREEVLSVQTLKRHYDALGHFLHSPTLSALKAGKDHRPDKMKDRCDELVAEVDKVVSSNIWHLQRNSTSELKCLKCDEPILRRVRLGGGKRTVKCFSGECGAEYEVATSQGDPVVTWTALASEIPCKNEKCDSKHLLWRSERRAGTVWKCEACGQKHKLALCAVKIT